MTTELSISGVLPATLHPATTSRLSAFCDSADSFASREEVYERTAASSSGAPAPDPDSQRVRVKTLRTRSKGERVEWTIQLNQKPEPPRTAPSALQFGVTEFAVEEGSDPRALVDSLGFSKKAFVMHRRGQVWRRGAVSVELFQLYESDRAPEPLDPASYAVSVSTRFTASSSTTTSAPNGRATSNPGTPGAGASQEMRDRAIAALEDVARMLKGLVDLARVD
ncbi:hypothetical protein JCM10296v2_007484 [Rhodotorula toruloides]